MNGLDIIICVFLSYCLLRGIFSGFVKEIASLVGILIGFYAACSYYVEISEYLHAIISDRATAERTGFLILFFVIFVSVNIMGMLIKYLVVIKRMGWGNRIAGAVLSLLNGVLIVNTVLISLMLFPSELIYFAKNSKCYPYTIIVSENSLTIFSKSLKKQFSDNIKKTEKDWKN